MNLADITPKDIKAALLQITDDVYGWAYDYALKHEADEERVWNVLVDEICDKLGMANDEDSDVNDALADLVDDGKFVSEIMEAEAVNEQLNAASVGDDEDGLRDEYISRYWF